VSEGLKSQVRTERPEWRQLLGLAEVSSGRRKMLPDPQRGPLLPIPQLFPSGSGQKPSLLKKWFHCGQ